MPKHRKPVNIRVSQAARAELRKRANEEGRTLQKTLDLILKV